MKTKKTISSAKKLKLHKNRFRQGIAVLFVLIFAVVGVSLLLPSKAATPETLLSLNKNVLASSTQDATPAADPYNARFAVDGNSSTRWSSQFADNQWIYVDLGATYNITHVYLNWEYAAGRYYQIQTSNDGQNWTIIYRTDNGAAGVNDIIGLNGIGRYVRMYGLARTTPYGFSLWDFNVYGSPNPLLSLNKPVLASSTQDATPAADPYNARFAVDGNSFTRWSSQFADNQWIYVDLGATYNITRVYLNWEYAAGKYYKIQTSNDGQNWSDLYKTDNGAAGVNDIIGLNGIGRYVRMYGTTRTTPYGFSLWDFNVYGSPVQTETLLSQGKPTLASSVYPASTGAASYLASYATDGSPNTRWSSNFSDPQWILVNLGATYKISRVVLNWEYASAKVFRIQTSDDGQTWRDIYETANGTGGVNNLQMDGYGKYVRMYGTSRNTPYGYSLWEFQVYGR